MTTCVGVPKAKASDAAYLSLCGRYQPKYAHISHGTMMHNLHVHLQPTKIKPSPALASPRQPSSDSETILAKPSISSLIQLRLVPFLITKIHRSTGPLEILRYSRVQ